MRLGNGDLDDVNYKGFKFETNSIYLNKRFNGVPDIAKRFSVILSVVR
jgi:hypothetical protein